MKPLSIQKINTLGKVGHVISVICIVLTCIALVACILGGIVLLAFPADFIETTVHGSVDFTIDLSTFVEDLSSISDTELQEVLSSEDLGSFSINGLEYAFAAASMDGGKLNLQAEGSSSMLTMGLVRGILVAAILSLGVLLACTFFVSGFCKSLSQCVTPFAEDVVKKLYQLAWVTLALPILSSLSESLSQSVMSGRLDIMLSIDPMEVILILSMFALSYIFRYGAQLQLESDETL